MEIKVLSCCYSCSGILSLAGSMGNSLLTLEDGKGDC